MIDTRLVLASAAALAALPVLSWTSIGAGSEEPSTVERPPSALLAAAGETGASLRPPPVPRTPIAARTAMESPEERYPPVTTVRPSIRIDDFQGADLEQVGGVNGVQHVTEVELGRILVEEARDPAPQPDGPRSGGARAPAPDTDADADADTDTEADENELDLALIDPSEFRSFVPQITADSAPLWERMDEGELAFTHERARELELDLGGHVLVGEERRSRLRVGAFASNGTPPIADVVLSRHSADEVEMSERSRSVLVAVADDVSPEEVAYRLRRVVDGEVTVIPDPRAGRDLTPQEQLAAPTIWDALAMCESSGDWRINTGNGYYGGLQFLPESWWLVGGTGMPHEASREEQIYRAERLLEIQGWGAWPACSSKLGLR
jgi:hypothetical protein